MLLLVRDEPRWALSTGGVGCLKREGRRREEPRDERGGRLYGFVRADRYQPCLFMKFTFFYPEGKASSKTKAKAKATRATKEDELLTRPDGI